MQSAGAGYLLSLKTWYDLLKGLYDLLKRWSILWLHTPALVNQLGDSLVDSVICLQRLSTLYLGLDLSWLKSIHGDLTPD